MGVTLNTMQDTDDSRRKRSRGQRCKCHDELFWTWVLKSDWDYLFSLQFLLLVSLYFSVCLQVRCTCRE